jgi:ankyrin repeat protein
MWRKIRDVFKEKEQQQFFDELGYDLDQTIDISHPNTQRTVLHDAVSEGNKKAAQQLLEQKVDVNQYHNSKDPEDCPSGTPLLLAIYNNHLNIAQLLLDYKANAEEYDSEGVPALSIAVGIGKEILVTLLKAGVNVNQETVSKTNATDENYMTALMYAVYCANIGAAKLLIRYGASERNSQNKSFYDFCFDEIVEEDMKEYIEGISSKTNALISGLPSVFPSKIIDMIAGYTSGGAYVKKNDPTYLKRIGWFSEQNERKNSERKVSDRKYSDEKDNKKEVAERPEAMSVAF